jgi:hypothetical protein
VRKTTPEPVKFEADNNIDLSTPNCRHKPIQAFTAALCTRNHSADFLNFSPTMPCAVYSEILKLRVVVLFVGRDAGIDDRFHCLIATQRKLSSGARRHFERGIFMHPQRERT